MTRAELVVSVADKVGLNRRDADKVVSAVFDAIKGALVEGDKVQLTGFGTFEVREKAAREGRNPRTGATIAVPASKAPAFKAGASLKKAVK